MRAEYWGSGVLSREQGEIAVHHVGDAHQFEEIDAVFAGDVLAAAGELFGEDRAPHQEHRHAQSGD